MKKTILFIIIIPFFWNCIGEPSPLPVEFRESYINNFVDPEIFPFARTMYNFHIEDNTIFATNSQSSIAKPDILQVSGGIHIWVSTYSKDQKSYYPDKFNSEISEKHAEYAQEMGDLSFNSYVGGVYKNLYISPCLTERVESIEITCDKDWGDAYPFGASLNDLFVMYYEDHYALVQNNYTAPEGTYEFSVMKSQEYPQAVAESSGPEFSAVDSPFIGNSWIFHLISAPKATDSYSFTITATFSNGITASATTEPAMIAAAE